MSLALVGWLGILVFVALVIIGMPIAFASFLVGIVGLIFLAGGKATFTLASLQPFSTTMSYIMIVLPLFMLMGQLASKAGLVHDAYRAARHWVGQLPGGLASATVLGGAIFGAACGSSTAAAAMITRVALPELENYNYDRRLSTGAIAVAGTLAIVIPPSGLIIIYGIMIEYSVAKLLIAGILPGLLTAGMYMLQITLRCKLNPELGGKAVVGYSWKERIISVKSVWGILVIAIVVMGGIYAGYFSPTEAAGVGAGATLVLALVTRRMNLSSFVTTMKETATLTCMVFTILVGILFFTRFLAYTEIPYVIADWLVGLPVHPNLILVGILIIYIFLGMIVEPIGMLMLTIPVIHPASLALGFDQIWLGILIVKMCELGLVTPPVGMNVYVVKGAAPHVSMADIFLGVIPFVLTDVVTIIILFTFPQITLALPNLMRGG